MTLMEKHFGKGTFCVSLLDRRVPAFFDDMCHEIMHEDLVVGKNIEYWQKTARYKGWADGKTNLR